MATLVEDKFRAVEVSPSRLLEPISPPDCARAPDWCHYFENVYRDAEGEMSRIPWADGHACPLLQAWLNTEAPNLVRPGATVCVCGCGLGDDAKELTDRGYEVTGFDVSPTAIHWARMRHPELADHFAVADLFNLPGALKRRADVVVEINTLQALHPDLRAAAAAGIASLAHPRGLIVTICRGCDESELAMSGPPYPLSPQQLDSLFAAHGFATLHPMDDFLDDGIPPVRRLRAVYKRGC